MDCTIEGLVRLHWLSIFFENSDSRYRFPLLMKTR